MKSKINKVFKNKIVFILIFVILIILVRISWPKIFNSSFQFARLSKVSNGKITIKILSSGYVFSENQINVYPKVSGEVEKIYVTEGQKVKTGDLLVKLDTSEIEKQIRDAQLNLESAELNLAKLKQPPHQLDVIQLQNALLAAKDQKKTVEYDLEKAYDDGFNKVANLFLDLPNVMSTLKDLIFGFDFFKGTWNLNYYADNAKKYEPNIILLKDKVYDYYNQAKSAYDLNLKSYNESSRLSSKETIKNLINESYATTKLVADAIKYYINLIQIYQNSLINNDIQPVPLSYSHLEKLDVISSQINNHLINLLSAKKIIDDNQIQLEQIERIIKEKEEALNKLLKGPDEIDLQLAELNVKKAKSTLEDLKDKLSDYYVKAPFTGIVSQINIKKFNQVSPSTNILVLLTNRKYIEVSFNEIDAVNIQNGQKAIITFDALPDIKIEGQISEMNYLGEQEQGVVIYKAKVVFNSDNNLIKPGMSANVEIIIKEKENILVVPNQAIKTLGNRKYVFVPDEREIINDDEFSFSRVYKLKYQPKIKIIKTGLSDDQFTEVLEGLKENEIIILNFINSQQNLSQNPSNQQGLFQRLIPNSRQFTPRSGVQNIQR